MDQRTLRRAAASVLLVGAACSRSTTDVSNQLSTRSLDGPWSTRAGGIVLAMTLKWTPDSVTGSGTYFVSLNSLDCGGATLTGNGTVSLAASRSQAAITGYMKFDNGWSPPYLGTLADSSRIDGRFMSVDRGPCPFPLYFGLVP